ncbi:pilus assembly protein PilC [Acidovorax sp. HDW3]|uniref:pilus assembly protein n=1 Tax=Acidovorax sp. HDW3 TaxID=2714923 RepID=UPI00140C70B3|nr:PilC/PilY family type IV pilus protein [Acidovorax sp. HDW3]QIL43374.1 pilus assembly protein PilC [Acidovorax sp. HDW3]
MPRTLPPRFRKNLLALAAGAALAPHAAWALDLATSPPGTTQPYVAPNVIISVDDSGSMGWAIDPQLAENDKITQPKADGTWDSAAPRINILKYSLQSIFDPTHSKYDASLLPDKKIRLSWQSMWNNGRSPNASSVYNADNYGNITSQNTNSMRPLEGNHRNNFVSFVKNLYTNNGTPSHLMFTQADAYMRAKVSKYGPWSTNPGGTNAASTEYLGCRRNYHIFMSDGRWNGTIYSPTDTSRRDNATNISLADGNVYGGSTAAEQVKTALYRDSWNTTTLADWAFYSWGTPLQTTGVSGAPEPTAEYRNAPNSEDFGTDSTGKKNAVLEKYWNPKYDPATWPHMVTYTIGFSGDATTWPDAPTIFAPTDKTPFGYNGSFPDFVTGNKSWPNMRKNGKSTDERVRALDLWHAAINGRGRFYAVNKGEDLEKAFREIIGAINVQTDPDLSSNATSGSNTSRNDVGKYTAAYDPKNGWKGFVQGEIVQKGGLTTIPNPGWNGETTADKLDAAGFNINTRVVVGWSDQLTTAGPEKGGVAFRWANDETYLSSKQRTWLQKNTAGTDEGATKGGQRLNYIRGDKSLEGTTTSQPYRQRQSIQGDIINSVVWYTGAPASNLALKGYTQFVRANSTRPAMIYVGGNDGMLHGFAAADGSETLAYVPRGAMAQLRYLTVPEYKDSHKFFVDGSPMTGDVDMGTGTQDPQDPNYNPNYQPDWRTLLVGTMGLGGKGYFVLDVTNPTTAAGSAPAFVEASAGDLVKLDRTRNVEDTTPDCVTKLNTAQKAACNKAVAEDADIGHITARPVIDEADPMRSSQITRLNNNRWAVVMGNGYNSKNQRPVLLIQYLDGDKELLRIPVTGTADIPPTPGSGLSNDNGLSAPRLVDLNGDGRPDIAYAGDNLGNMWKFDLTNITAANWSVAFSGSPLFTAQGPGSYGGASRTVVQPISTVPTVRANDRMKTVGTGPSATSVKVGGMMVAFGTGRNVTKLDPASNVVQTLYSVLDNTRYKIIDTTLGKRLQVHPGGGTCPNGADCVPTPTALGTGVATAKLAEQTINDGDSGTLTAKVAMDWNTHNGWFLDMPATGERLLKPMEFYDGTNILRMYSQVPAKGSNANPDVESCDEATLDVERQYRTDVNIMDGQKASFQITSVANDGVFNDPNGGPSRIKVTAGSHTNIVQGNRNLDVDVKNKTRTDNRSPEQSMRPSWRQVK